MILFQINLVLSKEPLNSSESEKIEQFHAIYRIDSKLKGYPFIVQKKQVLFSNKKVGKEENFRIYPTGKSLNSYYIVSKPLNLYLGINDKGNLVLYRGILKNKEKIEWYFIRINSKDYLIQNSFNKRFIQAVYKMEKKKEVYYPMCSSGLDLSNLEKISNSYKFSFFKLCEEVELKPEHIEIIEKEPVDVLIKYIDLTDKTLNRKGITQIKKDEDNEELRYCVRSILQYIPWIRKIFILMPNERVKYFKPINEINNKIVYVKDKDLLGFDSASSVAFQFHLFNMAKFGLSENFILMDDDYFFGKPIKKTDFFYYDETLKKVVPSIVTDDFSELIKNDIIKEYDKLFRRRRILKPHTFNGWKITQLASYKLLLEQYPPPLINAGFSHNAMPYNLNDSKEIYDLIKKKYPYAQEVLSEKVRHIFDLQPQSLFNAYALNIKKRKVNSIPSIYYDLAFLKGKNFNIEMFVINTSGDRKYNKNQFNNAKQILEKKFFLPTPFEADINIIINGKKKNIDLSEYVKINEYNKLKENYKKIEKFNAELDKKIDGITKEKNRVEKYYKEEINLIFENINNLDINNSRNYTYNINYTKNTNELNQKDILKKYNILYYFFKTIFILLLIVLFFFIFYFYFCKTSSFVSNEKIIQMSNLSNNQNESFSKLSTEE